MESIRRQDETFDPEGFLDLLKNFSKNSTDPDGKLRQFIIKFLDDTFKNGEIAGDRLLDVGTGPVCYSVYAASWWFREITLSDIAEENLAALRAWKSGKRKDLDSLFSYMIELNGNREDLVTAHQRLAQKVKSVVKCDLRKADLLHGTEVEDTTFDVIILSLCQSVASFTCDEYKGGIAAYSRHLKQGGHVIVLDGLEGSYYRVGKETFASSCFTKQDLKTMYRECGYDILTWIETDDIYDRSYDERRITDLRRAFAMVARKL